MAIERTFSIIKPDATERNITGEICSVLEKNGLKIVASRRIKMTQEKAAQFLQRFVNKTPWAHLDIAGTTWTKSLLPTSPKGSTAFGVKLLNRFVNKYYEGK